MRLLPAAESKLALHPHSRHGLHNTAYESKIARLCQPVGRPGWGGEGEKKKEIFWLSSPPAHTAVLHHLTGEGRKGAVKEKA